MNTTKDTITLNISGMTCSNCARGIEKHLYKKGFKEVVVDFTNAEATIEVDDLLTKEKAIKHIENIGFETNSNKSANNKIEKLFLFCLIFTIPLFSHMFLGQDHILQNPILQFILCLPVYIVALNFFGKSAFKSLKSGVPNMDVLIIIGTSSAFFYSIAGTYMFWGLAEQHQYLFFETSATITTLVLLGNLLEHKSVKQTTTAIKELNSIQEFKAKKINTDGSITEVDFNTIQKEDVLIVNAGDKIPTDGIIIQGNGLLDESLITGENKPQYKSETLEVTGGTLLIDGSLRIRATKIKEETVLSQIIQLVKKAQNNKPEIQKLGDKISGIFVPAVLIIAIFTFVFNHYVFDQDFVTAIMRSIAVLVISCPCAMGLATPTAVMVGLGRAAKMGVLIKGGSTLEEFAKIKTIVFDKTGTVTTGKFKIKKIEAKENRIQEIKNIIYNLELHSSHPIAKSITKELSEEAEKIDLTGIKEYKGSGMEAQWNKKKYALGSETFTKQSDNNFNLFLTEDKQCIAKIKITDEIKSDASFIIKTLNKEGIQTVLLSGDKKQNCQQIGKEIGIDKIYGQQLPHQKLEIIENLSKHSPTAMVGDGINDAPALTKAQVGISLNGSTQIAIDSAQILLLNSQKLEQLCSALKISKHTLLTIKQNLFWAFSYNLIAIPIAAMGFLDPMQGAFFMAFSDVIVIGNSLRLKSKKLK